MVCLILKKNYFLNKTTKIFVTDCSYIVSVWQVKFFKLTINSYNTQNVSNRKSLINLDTQSKKKKTGKNLCMNWL